MLRISLYRMLLLAALILSVSGCSLLPSKPQTVLEMPAAECLQLCELLTPPASDDPNVVYAWTVGLVNTYGICRRKHEVCVNWQKSKAVSPSPRKP